MSKIALTPNASGTGTLTIAAPNTNTDRTLTLPDASGTIATLESIPAGYTDADALALLNASGAAPVYAARAWVNFNGTGTVAIRASGNVSSVSDFGTGFYGVSFTTAMPDALYAVLATTSATTSTLGVAANNQSVSAQYLAVGDFALTVGDNNTDGSQDAANVFVAIFR